MGKGFNNYMCKKFFHPGSIDNLKRVWMAQQKTDAEKKKQEELKAQYEKEQEAYNNKALLAKGENKEKLSLNFMYEPPAGMKKEREREDGEPEYKFEWQRKYNGPRESYLSKDDDTIRDQPFGIQVRNVRCIKCKKWGHINTDKECELYTAPWELTNPTTSADPLELMKGMRDNGLALKAGVIEGTEQIPVNQLVASDDGSDEEETEEMKFIKSLSQKDKLRLLKKLTKLQKKKKKQKKRSKSRRHSSTDTSSDDDGRRKSRKHHAKSEDHLQGNSHWDAFERQRRHGTSDHGMGCKLKKRGLEKEIEKRSEEGRHSKKHFPQDKEKRTERDKISPDCRSHLTEKRSEEERHGKKYFPQDKQKRRREKDEKLPEGSLHDRHHKAKKGRHERSQRESRKRHYSDSESSSPERKRGSYEQKGGRIKTGT